MDAVSNATPPQGTNVPPADPQVSQVPKTPDEALTRIDQALDGLYRDPNNPSAPKLTFRNHFERVKAVQDAYAQFLDQDKALPADQKSAPTFLKQIESLGQPLGLNFGLRHRDAQGVLGAVLNTDPFKGVDAGNAFKQKHDALLNEWKSARAQQTQTPQTQPTDTTTGQPQPSYPKISDGLLNQLDADKQGGTITQEKVATAVQTEVKAGSADAAFLSLLAERPVKSWETADVVQAINAWNNQEADASAEYAALDPVALVEKLTSESRRDGRDGVINVDDVRRVLETEPKATPERAELDKLLLEMMLLAPANAFLTFAPNDLLQRFEASKRSALDDQTEPTG
jgi:hypothetical protein